jgi:perosamine synthetase
MFPALTEGESLRRFPVSNRLWERGFYIPSYIGMGDDVIARVAEAIRSLRKGA